jgi:rare lipoprotein A
MSSTALGGSWCDGLRADPGVGCAGGRGALRLLAVALVAAALAACAQPAAVIDGPAAPAVQRTAPPEAARTAQSTRRRTVAAATTARAVETRGGSYGVASYYRPTRTASGEKVDTAELTAAHRTLPFGTRLRVTNLATGRAVTVRVNDRGPFIAGRVVDVSYPAAEKLGMVGPGVAKVKLDVVQ